MKSEQKLAQRQKAYAAILAARGAFAEDLGDGHIQATHQPIVIEDWIREEAQNSVLCWLATTGEDGFPNVSPKEIFAFLDDGRLAIAHIASPTSVRNITRHPQVCVSFVDIFRQKGGKLKGMARVLYEHDSEFAYAATPLLALTEGKFPVRAVLLVSVMECEKILAPSYLFYPDTTTEAAQVESALKAYGVHR